MRIILLTLLVAATIYSCQKPSNSSTHIYPVGLSLANALDSMHIQYDTLYHVAINTNDGTIDSANSLRFYKDSIKEYYDIHHIHADSVKYAWSSGTASFQGLQVYDYANPLTNIGYTHLVYYPLNDALLSNRFAFHNYFSTDTLYFAIGYPANIRNHSEFFKPNVAVTDSQAVTMVIYK